MSRRETKKLDILLAGLDVMKRKGYNGTSVKDIVDAAGVPKGSFYNYFDSKEAFALDAIDYVAEQGLEYASRLLKSAQPPAERLISFFEMGASNACDCDYRMGCFLGNMCQEMADSSELICNKLRNVLRKNTALLQNVLEECGQDSAQAATTAEFLFNSWEGALMRAKASRSHAPLEAFIATLPRLIE